VTAKTLEEIGAGHIPVVYLYNKTDLAMAQAGAGTSETAVFTRVEAGRSGTAAFTRDASGTAAFTRDTSGTAAFTQDASGTAGTATAARSASGKRRPVSDSIPFRRGEVLYLAAGRGVGIPDILTLIDDSLSQGRSEAEFLIPYHRGAVLQEIRSCGVLLAEDYQADGIHVRARCRREDIRRLQRMLGES
jgi:50S ribosomal subunit-associated GTPase HflX